MFHIYRTGPILKNLLISWNEKLIDNVTQCSMVGKGFITDGEDIICPECAKKKLMADSIEQ